jgi:hypothetical protein
MIAEEVAGDRTRWRDLCASTYASQMAKMIGKVRPYQSHKYSLKSAIFFKVTPCTTSTIFDLKKKN